MPEKSSVINTHSLCLLIATRLGNSELNRGDPSGPSCIQARANAIRFELESVDYSSLLVDSKVSDVERDNQELRKALCGAEKYGEQVITLEFRIQELQEKLAQFHRDNDEESNEVACMEPECTLPSEVSIQSYDPDEECLLLCFDHGAEMNRMLAKKAAEETHNPFNELNRETQEHLLGKEENASGEQTNPDS